jgi:hypothetical protein
MESVAYDRQAPDPNRPVCHRHHRTIVQRIFNAGPDILEQSCKRRCVEALFRMRTTDGARSPLVASKE